MTDKTMNRIILLIILLGMIYLLFGCAEMKSYRSDYKYNWREDRWEFANPSEKLKYNIYQDDWRYSE